MPPEFNSLPPVTKITRSLQIGEKVLRVQAQDGDRGSPRSIKYTLINDGSPITSFFNISESSGTSLKVKYLCISYSWVTFFN